MKNIATNIVPDSHAARILLATAVLLLFPLIAMQLSDQIVWTFSDFVIATVLLLGAGFTWEFCAKKARSARQKIVIGIGIFVVLALIWVELAVGIFGTPLAGS